MPAPGLTALCAGSETEKKVLRALEQGWSSLQELGDAGAHMNGITFMTLMRVSNATGLLCVPAPGPAGEVLYHLITNEARDAATWDTTDFMALPRSLKISFVQKLESLRETNRAVHVPDWMRAAIALENRLNEMGLSDLCLRPDDGFLYPCSWRVRHIPTRLLGQADANYSFLTAFVGRISLEYMPEAARNKLYLLTNRQLSIKAWDHMNEAYLATDALTMGRVSAERLAVIRHPPREKVIALTMRRIEAAASRHPLLIPFTTINNRFELLSAGGMRKER